MSWHNPQFICSQTNKEVAHSGVKSKKLITGQQIGLENLL